MNLALFGNEMRPRVFFNHNYFFIARDFLHVADKLHQTLPLFSNLGTTGAVAFPNTSLVSDAELLALEAMHDKLAKHARAKRINEYYATNAEYLAAVAEAMPPPISRMSTSRSLIAGARDCICGRRHGR